MRRSLGVAMLLAAGASLGADDAALRSQVEQRIKLSARLLADSPAAQRITASGNDQAVGHLDEGRLHHSMAEDLLRHGDLAGAQREIDDALRHLATARRLVPDAQARQLALRQRVERHLTEVDRLIDAWRGRVAAGDKDDDLVAAVGLVGSARYLAQEGRYDEAGRTLATAESHVLAGLNRLLRARTLDYTARPATPGEEYQFELLRHKELLELLPLALTELRPRPEAVALIERYGENSRALRAQAQQRFQAGDTPQALSDIRNAVLFLQRALAAAGVNMPEPVGTPP